MIEWTLQPIFLLITNHFLKKDHNRLNSSLIISIIDGNNCTYGKNCNYIDQNNYNDCNYYIYKTYIDQKIIKIITIKTIITIKDYIVFSLFQSFDGNNYKTNILPLTLATWKSHMVKSSNYFTSYSLTCSSYEICSLNVQSALRAGST